MILSEIVNRAKYLEEAHQHRRPTINGGGSQSRDCALDVRIALLVVVAQKFQVIYRGCFGITQAKKSSLRSTRNKLEVSMERLNNQVEIAKLADNKEELAKLQQLLDESRQALDAEDDSFFADKSNDEFADEWLKDKFR